MRPTCAPHLCPPLLLLLLQGDAEDLPFPTDTFDRYVSAGSIGGWGGSRRHGPPPTSAVCPPASQPSKLLGPLEQVSDFWRTATPTSQDPCSKNILSDRAHSPGRHPAVTSPACLAACPSRRPTCLPAEYWPEPQRGICEAYRVIKPGGVACMIGPVHPTYPLSRTMADLWMLFPTEEEYIKVGAAGGRLSVCLCVGGCARACIRMCMSMQRAGGRAGRRTGSN